MHEQKIANRSRVLLPPAVAASHMSRHHCAQMCITKHGLRANTILLPSDVVITF